MMTVARVAVAKMDLVCTFVRIDSEDDDAAKTALHQEAMAGSQRCYHSKSGG